MAREIQELVRNPRTVELLSMLDGNVYSFKDDGASVTGDGVFPNGMRQQLLRNLQKQQADGSPVYVTLKKIAPLYDGDPVSRAAVFNDTLKAKLEENKAKRTAKLDYAAKRGLEEAEQIAKTMKRATPKTEAPLV